MNWNCTIYTYPTEHYSLVIRLYLEFSQNTAAYSPEKKIIYHEVPFMRKHRVYCEIGDCPERDRTLVWHTLKPP